MGATDKLIDVPEMFEALLQACPGARPRWEEHCREWQDEEPVPYLEVAVFAHYLVDCYGAGTRELLPAVFEAIERLVVSGNSEVRSLATIGLLEDLQNIASWKPFGRAVFLEYLGPCSRQAWDEIEEMWKGKGSLANVLRAEAVEKKKR